MSEFDHPLFHLPYNPKSVRRARELRAEMTPAERKIWYLLLKSYQPRFLRQRPIGQYIVDFYCASIKLIIEVDGDVHGTDEAEFRDHVREEQLKALGLEIIRFTNDDILMRFDNVVREIDRICLNMEE
jgi:very-short-patch-repair endonuclease